jgi:hypothetical protein
VKTRNHLTLLGGVGLGAGLMYQLDPDGGRRRRALARDKAVHGLKVGGRSLHKTSVHLGNKTKGLVARASSHLRGKPRVQESTEATASLQAEGSNGSRFSLRKVRPRAAVLGVGALAGTVGLGLLARNRKVDDLTRPLTGSRTVRGEVRGESSAQLEW